MMIPSHDPETYEKQALDMLPLDHPHYDEIADLLDQQIADDLEAYANSLPDRSTDPKEKVPEPSVFKN